MAWGGSGTRVGLGQVTAQSCLLLSPWRASCWSMGIPAPESIVRSHEPQLGFGQNVLVTGQVRGGLVTEQELDEGSWWSVLPTPTAPAAK